MWIACFKEEKYDTLYVVSTPLDHYIVSFKKEAKSAQKLGLNYESTSQARGFFE